MLYNGYKIKKCKCGSYYLDSGCNDNKHDCEWDDYMTEKQAIERSKELMNGNTRREQYKYTSQFNY